MVEISKNWIVNKNQDLVWLIGSSVFGFVLLSFFYLMTNQLMIGVSTATLIIYLFWTIFFDGTHVFATYSRTYLDRDYFQQNKPMLIGICSLLLFGPAILLTARILGGIDIMRASTVVFNRFALSFAYFHLVRQHWGVLCLYRKKNNENDFIGRKLDAMLLSVGTIYPFLLYYQYNLQPLTIAENFSLDIDVWKNLSTNLGYTGLISLFLFLYIVRVMRVSLLIQSFWKYTSVLLLAIATCIKAITTFSYPFCISATSSMFYYAFLGTGSCYILYTLLYRSSGSLNLPKLLLMASVLLVHNIIVTLPIPFLVIYPCVTIFHNMQYHRIVLFHNKNKYGNQATKERHGMAYVLTEKIAVFIFMALFFNVFTTIPRAAIDPFVHSEVPNYLIGALFWGVAMHHYVLDGIIWRPKKSTDLAQTLKLRAA